MFILESIKILELLFSCLDKKYTSYKQIDIFMDFNTIYSYKIRTVFILHKSKFVVIYISV